MSQFHEPWNSLPISQWPRLELQIRQIEEQIREARALGNVSLADQLEKQLPPLIFRQKPLLVPCLDGTDPGHQPQSIFQADDLTAVCQVLDELIEIEAGGSLSSLPLSDKLDRLSELIDALRFHRNELDTKSARRGFHPTRVVASLKERKLRFSGSKHVEESRIVTSPVKLALPLLDYLYDNPGGGRGVFSIINQFIAAYLPSLHPADFKRTATGVLRIMTNVRFAAATLRRNGLLQYTSAEAFKTWRLSFLGLLAAENFQLPRMRETFESDIIFQEKILLRLDPRLKLPSLMLRLDTLCSKCAIEPAHSKKLAKATRDALKVYHNIYSSTQSDRQKEVACQKLLVNLNLSDPVQRLLQAYDMQSEGNASLI